MPEVKKKFIISLTMLTILTGWAGAFAFRTWWPTHYFTLYPSIPLFFYAFGLAYLLVFEHCYLADPRKSLAVYLGAKVTKILLSVLIVVAYALAIKQEIVAFTGAYIAFYVIFLVFETRFFSHFEMKHKSNRYKYK